MPESDNVDTIIEPDGSKSHEPPNFPEWDDAPPPSDEDYFGSDAELVQARKPAGPGAEKGVSASVSPIPAGPAMVGKKIERDISGNLDTVLTEVFHFTSFRPYQREVCESVIQGRDLLLVMPTGSGKSLCYQLPGIVRNGTTLVVSPLIALMEDQTAGLKQKGFAAERIHSGRARSDSRKVCRDYLSGKLDFLFIAPERLAVSGFPEMLARRKPVLIAIDEAHCISQWGHDFRPDYRLLGERLPILRPAPVIAMTATATPRVQKDIVQQLGMVKTKMCIHGFRRTNIAIELVELMPSDRSAKVVEILQKKESRPAIVYAPTRQKTEDLARELESFFPAASYHAGLPAETRDSVQTSFLSGGLDVIVATIAFGMGIDKPDVRTVIHTALPGSLEGYYQEIGRAGRDEKPSRAILLHSYGDRRVHHFFHEKSYPREEVLKSIHARLTDKKAPSENLRRQLDMEPEEFEAALEKLWIHGGALVEPDETVRRGHNRWHLPYKNQSAHRLAQIDEISRFAGSFSCRMLYLVQHFGDRADNGKSCGICDFCAPQGAVASVFRSPDGKEQEIISELISTLRVTGGMSTGKLYTDVSPGSAFKRSDFENLLRSLTAAGLIVLTEHSFEKDGRIIHYRKAGLTGKGRDFGPKEIQALAITSSPASQKEKRKSSSPTKKANSGKVIRRPGGEDVSGKNPGLHDALRLWRMEAAKRKGVPAFRIFTNKVLDNLVADRPSSYDELYMVQGVGPYFVKSYGKEILRIVKEGSQL